MVTVTIEIEGTKQTRELHCRTTVIGRSRSADIRLVHPRISGRHARIEIAEDGTAELVDAGSKNGLLVGESRVNRVTVTDGLAVTIGPALFKFKTGGGQARAECLQRLQLPDPGVTGISPPPAPGSGLGTTRREIVAAGVSESNVSAPVPPHSPAAALLAELSKQSSKPAEPAPVSLEIAPPPPPSPLAPVVQEPKRSRHGRPLAGLVSAASTAGSLALAIGLHVFIAAVLSVCVYRQYSKPESLPLKLTLSPPKSLFVPPPDVWKGEGAGLPDGTREEPKFGKRPPAPEPGETETTPEFAAGALPAADPLASAAPRVSSAPRPAMA
ncbi:MAG: FHA domain-containing protein, partial [Planctomycetes bacterium]|nr:FHA domain-containing protein [Planctomycetota bacterium]